MSEFLHLPHRKCSEVKGEVKKSRQANYFALDEPNEPKYQK